MKPLTCVEKYVKWGDKFINKPSLYQRSDINMQELEIPWLSLFICGFASQNKKVKSVRFGDMVRTKSNTQTTNLLRLVQSQEPTLTLSDRSPSVQYVFII